MKSNNDQYHNELQSRYLKFMTNAISLTEKEPDEHTERRERRRKNRISHKEEKTNSTLTMDRMIESKYVVKMIVIDSAHRNMIQYPYANDFVVKTEETLRNVGAIRLIKTEYFEPCATAAYMVLNGAKVPLQTYNLDHAYIYLNGYINMIVANDTNTSIFGRISPGTEIYPTVAGDIKEDPYVHILRPAEPKLRRYHIRLQTHTGQLQEVANARVILTLGVYCMV